MSLLVGTYVRAMLIGTCVCYAYWYTCVLRLLVHMSVMLIYTHILFRMRAMLIGTHVCYAFWHTCMLCVLALVCRVFGLIIGTHVCFDYWLSENASALIICVNCVASDGDICKSQNRFTVVLVSFIQFEYLIIVLFICI